MRNRKWVNGRNIAAWAVCLVGLTFGAVGCTPAQQPFNTVDVEEGTPAPDAWKTLVKAALLGEQVQMYKIKMSVDVARGSTHSTFSVYGSINVPERALVSFHENTTNIQYYQQGLCAYQQLNNGRWTQTNAIDNLDVFPSYVRLMQSAMVNNIPVRQLKDTFVVDEYCQVFKATLPSSFTASLPIWDKAVEPKYMGDIEYTFYVGKTDGQLREITTKSVESTAETGAFQIQSDTTLFDLNNDRAKVMLPKDLIAQLESPGQ
jgi:hypothetical protein